MDVHVLGAGNTVTGSQFLLTTDRARVLIDCGMFQGDPHEVVRNRVPLGYEPSELDAILLTHAHLDHCGLIPHVMNEGFHGPIFATSGTAELAGLVLMDSGKLQEEFAKRHKHWALKHPDKALAEEQRDLKAVEEQIEIAQREDSAAVNGTHPDQVIASGLDELVLRDEQGLGTRLGFPPFGHPNHQAAMRGDPARLNLVVEDPLYTQDDAEHALGLFRTVEYETPVDVAPGIHATFHDAGHILGSSIIELHVDASGETPARTIVFSGDLGRSAAPILRDPTPAPAADYVFVESTYGGRTHEPQEESMRQLEQAVLDTVAQNGVLLVPAFAIGRTQEMVWALNHLLEAGRIPQVRVFLDSPMASKASAIYHAHIDWYDSETLEDLHDGGHPLDFPGERETIGGADSEKVAKAKRPYVVVASNGMLTGGRVLNHLRRVVGDSKALILFVGYQGEGTLGAKLQAGAKSVRIDGQEFQVRCGVRSIGGFSAHADEPQILDWLAGLNRHADGPKPRQVFLVHGDPEAQQALEPKVKALGLPVYVPHWHQRVRLD